MNRIVILAVPLCLLFATSLLAQMKQAKIKKFDQKQTVRTPDRKIDQRLNVISEKEPFHEITSLHHINDSNLASRFSKRQFISEAFLAEDSPGNGFVADLPANVAFMSLSAGEEGFMSINAGTNGFLSINSIENGFYSSLSGDDGFVAYGSFDDGFVSQNAGDAGFFAQNATGDGFVSQNSGGNGFYVHTATANGFHSLSAGNSGFYSYIAANDGFLSENSGDDGFQSTGASDDGFYSANSGNDGFFAYNSAAAGFSSQDATTAGFMSIGSAGDGFYSINNVGSAGYFSGTAEVTGNLSKGGGSFKIDHPIDPENKFLYHSFVESPDMMNVYNGNIVTDDSGFATVTLPDYFETLNRDFRYQLTVLGVFAQAIVKEKLNSNKFVIQTDQPGVEVSWQITGIRQDPYANANRIEVEVEKSPEFKGQYLHPEAYNMPFEKGFDYIKLGHQTLEEVKLSRGLDVNK
jgi:cold shock CspA family protein